MEDLKLSFTSAGMLSHMTGLSLQNTLGCTNDDIDHEQLAQRIVEVLLYKSYPLFKNSSD